MKSTLDLIHAYRAAHGGSANKAAPRLGVSSTQFALWASNVEHPSEERVIEMARALGFDIELAVVLLRRDRARSDEARSTWQRVYTALNKAAAVAIFAAAPFMTPPPAEASSVDINKRNTHWRPKRRGWLDSLPLF